MRSIRNGFVMWSQTWNVHDRLMVLPTPPGVVLGSQNLLLSLLSVGWCFLKQSLQ